jgi:thioredoxin reductase (NADPH)
VPGEDDFIGAGIHFCATCDAAFYKGAEELLIVGGGNSAAEEGIFLTRFAKKVTLVTITPELTASEILKQKIAELSEMEVITNATVAEFKGDKRLETVVIKDVNTNQTRDLHPSGVFVFIGLMPNTGFLKDDVKLNQWGFIETDNELRTNVPGVYACGDVRAGSTKQAASAAGEGATAALMIRNFLRERSAEREI